MVVAMSTLSVLALCAAALILLLLVAPAVRSFGRAAEISTDMGHRVTKDQPEFRKPPDEGGLL